MHPLPQHASPASQQPTEVELSQDRGHLIVLRKKVVVLYEQEQDELTSTLNGTGIALEIDIVC